MSLVSLGKVWYLIAREISTTEAERSLVEIKQLRTKIVDADWQNEQNRWVQSALWSDIRRWFRSSSGQTEKNASRHRRPRIRATGKKDLNHLAEVKRPAKSFYQIR